MSFIESFSWWACCLLTGTSGIDTAVWMAKQGSVKQPVDCHCQCLVSLPRDTGQAGSNAQAARHAMPTILALLPIALSSGTPYLCIAVLARRCPDMGKCLQLIEVQAVDHHLDATLPCMGVKPPTASAELDALLGEAALAIWFRQQKPYILLSIYNTALSTTICSRSTTVHQASLS